MVLGNCVSSRRHDRMSDDWQHNWDRFLSALTNRLQAGETATDLSAEFGGKQVTWTGILDEKRLEGLAPSVGIDVPPRRIDLGQRGSIEFGGLSLPVPNSAVA